MFRSLKLEMGFHIFLVIEHYFCFWFRLFVVGRRKENFAHLPGIGWLFLTLAHNHQLAWPFCVHEVQKGKGQNDGKILISGREYEGAELEGQVLPKGEQTLLCSPIPKSRKYLCVNNFCLKTPFHIFSKWLSLCRIFFKDFACLRGRVSYRGI